MAVILVVDDDRNQRLLLEEELRNEGYVTHSVASASEAMSAVLATQPDLIVIEPGRPGTGSLQLLGSLVGINSHLPIVVYTACDSHRDSVASWVANAYLLKRSDLTEFRRTLSRILRGQRISDGTPARA